MTLKGRITKRGQFKQNQAHAQRKDGPRGVLLRKIAPTPRKNHPTGSSFLNLRARSRRKEAQASTRASARPAKNAARIAPKLNFAFNGKRRQNMDLGKQIAPAMHTIKERIAPRNLTLTKDSGLRRLTNGVPWTTPQGKLTMRAFSSRSARNAGHVPP